MSRTAAKNTLSLEAERKHLDDLGVVHGLNSVSGLDEANGAYKDIEAVMDEQKDLVNIEVELTPMISINGK